MRRILAALLIVLAGPVFAEEALDCENAMAQQEMNACAAMDFDEADAELNAVWKEAIAAARDSDTELKDMGDDGRPGYEQTLKAAQRSWIGFRDEWCTYSGFQARGGSMEPMLVSGCMADLTRARTKDLKDDMEGLGN